MVSCPYAQAYIPTKAEAAGQDYKKMRKEPGPANKQGRLILLCPEIP